MYRMSSDFMSTVQDLINEAIVSQKCNMNRGPILSCYGGTDIWYSKLFEPYAEHEGHSSVLKNPKHDYRWTIQMTSTGTPHFGRRVTEFLNEQFPDRWIGRGGPQNWSLLSPDLTSLDFREKHGAWTQNKQKGGTK
jgi:hypothetical protein